MGFRSTDLAGNVEATQFVEVKLDGKVPVTASNADGATHNGSFTLVLTATDSLSGVAATCYSLDGGPFVSGTSVLVKGRGTHTIKFYSTDVAGNVEIEKTSRVSIK